MNRITAEALDGMSGRAADAMRMRLDYAGGGDWLTVAGGEADGEGRIDNWDVPLSDHGLYRVVLDSDRYYAGLGLSPAYPEVSVTVRVTEEQRCHVQVVLSPNAYSVHIRVIA